MVEWGEAPLLGPQRERAKEERGQLPMSPMRDNGIADTAAQVYLSCFPPAH